MKDFSHNVGEARHPLFFIGMCKITVYSKPDTLKT